MSGLVARASLLQAQVFGTPMKSIGGNKRPLAAELAPSVHGQPGCLGGIETVSRARPRVRRRFSILRPPGEAMRARNPCVPGVGDCGVDKSFSSVAVNLFKLAAQAVPVARLISSLRRATAAHHEQPIEPYPPAHRKSVNGFTIEIDHHPRRGKSSPSDVIRPSQTEGVIIWAIDCARSASATRHLKS